MLKAVPRSFVMAEVLLACVYLGERVELKLCRVDFDFGSLEVKFKHPVHTHVPH
jgi:hypothetical protein